MKYKIEKLILNMSVFYFVSTEIAMADVHSAVENLGSYILGIGAVGAVIPMGMATMAFATSNHDNGKKHLKSTAVTLLIGLCGKGIVDALKSRLM